MWFIIGIIAALFFTAAFLVTARPQGTDLKPNTLEDFAFPTASHDRVVPEVFGTVMIRGLNCLWYGDLSTREIEHHDSTVGYAYKMGLLYAVCGPVDEIQEFWKSDERMWQGSLTTNGTFEAMTGKLNTVGRNSRNGPTTVRCYLGSQTVPDPYIELQTGSSIPYKRTSLMVFEQAFIGDNVSAVEPFAAVVRRTSLGSWGSSYRNISGGANPAHAIAWILENMVGVPSSQIDTGGTFLSAAATLYSEGLGISFAMNSPQTAEKWIKEILRHIDGICYLDVSTASTSTRGKYVLTLIRDDYNLATVPDLDESDYRGLQIKRQGWEDTLTAVTVEYTDTARWDFNSIKTTNSAALATLGYAKEDTVSFPMFTGADAINHALARTMKKSFYPLAEVEFSVSKAVHDLSPGDVVKISNTGLGISDMVVRVLEASGETGQEIQITGVEDIFGIGNIGSVGIPGSDDPSIDFTLDDAIVHYYLADAMSVWTVQEEIMLLVAQPPTGYALGAQTFIGGVEQDTRAECCGTGTLEAAYAPTSDYLEGRDYSSGGTVSINASGTATFSVPQSNAKAGDMVVYGSTLCYLASGSGTTWTVETTPGGGVAPSQTLLSETVRAIYRETGFVIEDGHRVTSMVQSEDDWQAMKWLGLIEGTEEVFAPRFVISLGGSRYRVCGIIRNIEGRRGGHASHALGARVWLYNNSGGLGFKRFEYETAGAVIIAPQNNFNTGPETACGTHTYGDRPGTYRPPHDIQVSGSGAGASVTWRGCNRMGGAVIFSITTQASPERCVPAMEAVPEGTGWHIDGPGLGAGVDVPVGGAYTGSWTATGSGTFAIYTYGSETDSDAVTFEVP